MQMNRVEISSVRVTSGSMQHILLDDGAAVGVLSSYTVHPHTILYSLASPIEFCCVDCRDFCEATLVGIREQALLCPSCYAVVDDSSIKSETYSQAA